MFSLESLRSFSSRLLINKDEVEEDFDHNPNQQDYNWAVAKCKELDEWDQSTVIVMWIKKIKNDAHKQHKRLMVITHHRLMTARKGGSKKNIKYEVRRESHILDLVSVQETGLSLYIEFRDFKLGFQCDDDTRVIRILHSLYKNYQTYNPGFPKELSCKWLDQYKADQESQLSKNIPVPGSALAPWEKPARAFKSYAYFYREPLKDSLGNGLKSIMRRPLNEDEVDDERWLRTRDLGCYNPKTVHGLIMSVAFTTNILDGIEISDCKGDNALLYAIGICLQYNTSLGSIVLDGCCHNSDWGGLLVRAFAANPMIKLRRFGLRNCKIGDKGLSLWIEGNRALTRQPTSIYCTKANVSNKTMVQFIMSLKAKNENGRGLSELDISENSLENRGSQMLANRIVKDFHDLQILNISKCNIDCPIILTSLEQASRSGTLDLQELNISGNKMSQQDGLILSRILAASGSFAALSIAGCGLGGSTIAACLAAMLCNDELKFYTRIDASDNSIGCQAAIMLASIFVTSDRIMALKLNNCDLTHEGMGYVLHSLLNQPRLKLLELDCNCKRNEWNSGSFHVNIMLQKIMNGCLNLEALSIKNDPEREFQVDLDDFLRTLKRNESLMSLDISGNNMTQDNLAALKDVVIHNQTLRELHWDKNNITSRHIQGMTHALKSNRSLQVVEFPNHDFTCELSREKNTTKKMELQMLKKAFYRAVFDNNARQGFITTTVNVKRAAAKRNSIMVQRPGSNKMHFAAKLGGPSLGLPTLSERKMNDSSGGRNDNIIKHMNQGIGGRGRGGGGRPGGRMPGLPMPGMGNGQQQRPPLNTIHMQNNFNGGQMQNNPNRNHMQNKFGGGQFQNNQNSNHMQNKFGGQFQNSQNNNQNKFGGGYQGNQPQNEFNRNVNKFNANQNNAEKEERGNGNNFKDIVRNMNKNIAEKKRSSGIIDRQPPPFKSGAENIEQNIHPQMNAAAVNDVSDNQPSKHKKSKKKKKKKKHKHKQKAHEQQQQRAPLNPMQQMGGGPPPNPMQQMGGGPPPNPMHMNIGGMQFNQNNMYMNRGGPPPNMNQRMNSGIPMNPMQFRMAMMNGSFRQQQPMNIMGGMPMQGMQGGRPPMNQMQMQNNVGQGMMGRQQMQPQQMQQQRY